MFSIDLTNKLQGKTLTFLVCFLIGFFSLLFFLVPNFDVNSELNSSSINIDDNIKFLEEKISKSFYPFELRQALAKLYIHKAKSAKDSENKFKYYGKAIAEYQKLIKSEDLFDIRMVLANIFLELGQPKKAIPHLSRAKQLQPNNTEVLLEMGKALFQAEKFQRAKVEFEDYLKQSSIKDANAYLYLARISFFEDDYRLSLARLEIAQKKDPKNVQVMLWLGKTHGKLLNIESAIIAYNKAASLEPKNLEANIRLGHLYIYTKDFENSQKYFNKVVEIDYKNSDAYDGLGHSFIGLKNYEDAEVAFKKAVTLDSKNASAFYGLAIAATFNKNYYRAIDYLKTCIALDDSYKAYAEKDSYLEPLWNKKRFKLVLEKPYK